MISLVRAEVRKLRTTQVASWLLGADVAVSALVVAGSLASHESVRTPDDLASLFANANGALLTAFLLGVIGITAEFRHQTITSTVLGTPTRHSIVSAKLITYGGAGIVYGIMCVAVQVAIAAPWLASRHVTVDVTDATLLRTLLGMPAVFALFATMGIGIGALLRNQTLAVTLGLVFLLVIQNLIIAIPGARDAWAYTPGGATTAILFPEGHSTPGGVHALAPAIGLLALFVWTLVPGVVALVTTVARDIT